MVERKPVELIGTIVAYIMRARTYSMTRSVRLGAPSDARQALRVTDVLDGFVRSNER